MTAVLDRPAEVKEGADRKQAQTATGAAADVLAQLIATSKYQFEFKFPSLTAAEQYTRDVIRLHEVVSGDVDFSRGRTAVGIVVDEDSALRSAAAALALDVVSTIVLCEAATAVSAINQEVLAGLRHFHVQTALWELERPCRSITRIVDIIRDHMRGLADFVPAVSVRRNTTADEEALRLLEGVIDVLGQMRTRASLGVLCYLISALSREIESTLEFFLQRPSAAVFRARFSQDNSGACLRLALHSRAMSSCRSRSKRCTSAQPGSALQL